MKYLIEKLSDLNTINIKDIGNASEEYLIYFEKSINLLKDKKKQFFVFNEIRKFNSAINILKQTSDLESNEKLKANSLLDNYNSTYQALQSKYEDYSKDVFKPITERWRFTKNKNTTFFNYSINTSNEFIDTKLRTDKLKLILKDEKSKLMFYEFERKLVTLEYLNNTRNKWLKDASSLYRFVHYCSINNLFIDFYSGESFIDAFKIFREIYDEHRSKDYNKIGRKDGLIDAKPDEFNFLEKGK